MRKSLLVLLIPGLAGIAACGAPFFCPREAIRATLQTPRVSGEDALDDTLAGNFESRRDENAELTAMHAAIEGRTLSGRGISLWLGRGLDHSLNLGLRFPTPLRAGNVLPAVEVFRPDNPIWGSIPNPPAGVSVALRLDAFMGTSVSGSARVLEVDPLRVELHLIVSGTGRQIPIDGVLLVRHEGWMDSCFE